MARAGAEDDPGYPTGRNAVPDLSGGDGPPTDVGPLSGGSLPRDVRPLRPVNHATRVLASKAVVHRGWAKAVYRRLVVKEVELIAPSPGIDLRFLARQAAWAVHEERATSIVVTLLFWGAGGGMTLLALFCWLAGVTPLAVLLLLCATFFALLAYAVLVARTEHMYAAGREMAWEPEVEARDDDYLVRRDQDARLDTATRTLVHVYREGGGVDVFAGFGVQAYNEVRPAIDIGVRPNADPRVPGFTNYELLERLTTAVGDKGRRDRLDDGRHSELVLHMRGADVWGIQYQQGRPGYWPSTDDIPQVADNPTAAGRVYLRAQSVQRGAQLVVTLHMSAEVRADGLSLHPIIHVLRRIDGKWNTARSLKPHRWQRAWRIALQWGTPARLVASPLNWWRLNRLVRRGRRLPDELVHPDRIVDPYGPRGGLRHYTIGRTGPVNTDRVDLERAVAELMRGTYREVIRFLEEKGLNTAKFALEEETVVTNAAMAVARGVLDETVRGDAPDGNVEYGLLAFEGR